MNNRITELISAAEQYIEAKQYTAALEYLAAAEQIEPNNKSIHMIKELVHSLKAESAKPSRVKRFLSVTVDPKSPTGVDEETAASMQDVRRRVQSLTASAEYFLSRGLVENAFESLMRAYLLDPVAPEVIACEHHVLPAWQRRHSKPVLQAKQEWKLNLNLQRPKTRSTLFERLKSGKLFA